jgi:ankyrin repeat protein
LTPLAYAVTCEHEPIIELLCKVGANIEIQDNEGETIMDNASEQIKTKIKQWKSL